MLAISTGAVVASLAGPRGMPSASAKDYDEPVEGSQGLSAYQDTGQVLVRWNNSVIAAYRAHPTQKYPYFSSLAGPATGTPLTTESSLPYPHHRGLWLGCQPLNGDDFWSDGTVETGHIKSTGLRIASATPESVVIADNCDWIGPESRAPCRDERTFTISVPSDRVYLIDVALALTAKVNVVIDRAKHSFFALRAAPDISPSYGGKLVNSAGQVGAEATYGQSAAWCDYHGPRRARPEVVEGIAMMDHPKNPWAPCPWFTRDYGHLSPSPFSFCKEPWTLGQGESIRLRYLVVLHAGDPREAGLDGIYERWIDS